MWNSHFDTCPRIRCGRWHLVGYGLIYAHFMCRVILLKQNRAYSDINERVRNLLHGSEIDFAPRAGKAGWLALAVTLCIKFSKNAEKAQAARGLGCYLFGLFLELQAGRDIFVFESTSLS